MLPGESPRERLAWIAGGAVLLLLAWLLREHAAWMPNVLIPAGAWALLRGLI